MLSLLPVLACAAMMFGGGAIVWLARRTPLGRVSWFERRARHADPKGQDLHAGALQRSPRHALPRYPEHYPGKAPVLDARGTTIHRRGLTDAAGLYFLGMKNQHSRGSSLIHWVRHDAAFIVEQLRDRQARPESTRPHHQPGRGAGTRRGQR